MSISDAVLAQHIQTTLQDVATLLSNAAGVKARARTVYYKAVILSLASVVEAQVYHLIQRKCAVNPTLYQKSLRSYRPKIPLNKTALGVTVQFYVAEEVITPRILDNITGSFNSMNDFCKEKGLLPAYLHSELEYTRKKRNTIHLQTLTTRNRSYTLSMAFRIAGTVVRMYDQIDNC